MNNCTIVLFGASGDLARRKIIPALYHMIARGKLEKFLLVGASRDNLTPAILLERSREFIGEIDQHAWHTLLSSMHYHQLDFTQADDFQKLAVFVDELEKQHAMSGNRIFYLAAAASFFCDITAQLASCGLARRTCASEKPWHRLVYEKPFGHDLKSAERINECIKSCFYEEQIYRIDHFLTKELVGNIALVRFTNSIFEPLWSNRYIDQVQIILGETIGIEGRGAYYDAYGALCDVVQNHMLEMLALIAMEAPEKLTGDFIRDARAQVLKQVYVQDGILGQYAGYQNESHVAPDSHTETFAALTLAIENPRWQGVPFYLKTGKKLAQKETVIHIIFKQVACLLAKACPREPNCLTIEISPKAGFVLNLNAKTVGKVDEVNPIAMEYCHSCLYGPLTPEDYQTLFEEIMRGEQSVAVRFDEIESAWKITDQIKARSLPVYSYQPGSPGPDELQQFEEQHQMRWKS